MVEEGGDVWSSLAGDGFHPDLLVRRDLGHVPVNRDAFHDRFGGKEDRFYDFIGCQPALVHVGHPVTPGEGDEFAIREIFRGDEARFQQPVVGENHAGVELVGDEPDLDFWRALGCVGGDGVALDEGGAGRRGGRQSDEIARCREEGGDDDRKKAEAGHRLDGMICSGGQEGADVLADAGVHGDSEGAVAGNFEGFIGGDEFCGGRAVDGDFTGAVDDLHEFRGAGGEAVGAGENDTECFFGTVGEMDGM